MRLALLVGSLALTVACVSDDPRVGTTTQAAWWGGCMPLCGTNSTILDGVPFPELALDGTANAYGVSLVGAKDHTGNPVTLGISGDNLLGSGKRLRAKSVITVAVAGPGISETYDLEIAEVTLAPHWVDSGSGKAHTYRIRYNVNGEGRDLCPVVYDDDGIANHHFVAFGGERYDHEKKSVSSDGSADRWINFACTGTVISKLHLNRHTEAGSSATHSTTLAERQAMLKMYVADYCGDGTSYTVTGTPLLYSDDNGWFDPLPGWSTEGVWNENGAACVDLPRYVDFYDIDCWPKLTSCYLWPGDEWMDHGHLMTEIP